MNRTAVILVGVAATVGFTALWHGPLGAGERLATQAEAAARARLDRDEMFQVRARMERGPLARRLIVSGPADDFQRAEIRRRLDEVPGILDVKWDPASLPQEQRQAQ
jgi:hypothetical protein